MPTNAKGEVGDKELGARVLEGGVRAWRRKIEFSDECDGVRRWAWEGGTYGGTRRGC